jgi:hypothetical protein
LKQINKSGRQKVWLVVDHPMYFAIALAMISYWGKEKYSFNLLISTHEYWERVDINLYKHLFDEIHYLGRPDYTSHPVRVLHMIFQIQRLKKKIRQLGVSQDHVIIGFSIVHYLENIVLSTCPQAFKIGVMPYAVYQESLEKMDSGAYLSTIEGWVASSIIEPLFGLYRTYCMRYRLHPKHYWHLRYKKPLTEIYNKLIVLGNFSDEQTQLEENTVTMPFPYLLALQKKPSDKKAVRQPKKVIFFGTTFNTKMELTLEKYLQCLNQCLSFLREQYGATYQLVYRPHPAGKDEVKYLDLDRFQIEENNMLSELYYYHNFEDIYAIFSIASTSSRSGLACFINSFVFLYVFPYSENTIQYFRQTMGNVPDDFYLKDLTQTPHRYLKEEEIDKAVKRCQQVLDRILLR